MFPLAFSEYLVVKAWKRTLVIMQQGGVSTCDKGGSLAVEGKMAIIDAYIYVYLCDILFLMFRFPPYFLIDDLLCLALQILLM